MDLTTEGGRKAVVEYIESDANKGRKSQSYQASEIMNDRLKPYVVDALREQFSEKTVEEMPIVSSINIAKRVVNQLACIYKDSPERQFTDVTDEQAETLGLIYEDMMANKKLNLANKIFKNHDQCLGQIIPKDGKLIMRILKPFQYDAIPSEKDPEVASAIIISSYDNYYELEENSDIPNAATGHRAEYRDNRELYKDELASKKLNKRKGKKYLVWTLEENFIMDETGRIVGDVEKTLVWPFFEVSTEKEFEYWVRAQNTYSEFTVDFNCALSQVQQVVKMQGFAVAIIKCPPEVTPTNMQIGPNYIVRLPYDPNANIDSDFSFASPSADISGSLQYLETLLTTFLTSNGIDPKTVSMNGDGQTYSSGIERLLAMIEKVSASREDYDTFQRTEDKVYRIIKGWLDVLSNTDTLDSKYQLGSLPEDSKCVVTYAQPELVKSDAEELDIISREIELGISSPIRAIQEREGLSREQAEEKYLLYQQDNGVMFGTENNRE